MFDIYVVPYSASINAHVGHYRPSFDKRRRPPKRYLPLTRAPTVAESSLFLVLLSLIADGGLSTDGLRTILHPDFTRSGPRKLVIASGWYVEY